jgi:murein DD-endopeptidase MepM/ murein hydrolase activator NlpD
LCFCKNGKYKQKIVYTEIQMTLKDILKSFISRLASSISSTFQRVIRAFAWSSIKNFFIRLPQRLRRLRSLTARDVVEWFERRGQSARNFLESTQHTYYRVVIMNNDTFEEVGAVRLSLMNLYVSLSSIFVALSLMVASIIVFTPIKKYIPGYAGSESGRAMLQMEEQLSTLQDLATANETYINDRFKFLNGQYEYEDDVIKNQSTTPTADTTLEEDVSVIPEDSELRREVREGNVIPRIDAPATPNNTPTEGGQTSLKTLSHSINSAGQLEQIYFISPLSGEISQGFNLEKRHYGIDITAPKNTAIKAAADGFVVASDWTLETGLTIAIQHANNVITFYKHNSLNLKKIGEKVKAGEAVAIIGNTGEQSSGSHLHFELWFNGKAINPQEYIRF